MVEILAEEKVDARVIERVKAFKSSVDIKGKVETVSDTRYLEMLKKMQEQLK